MTKVMDLPPHAQLAPETAQLRREVREFLEAALQAQRFTPRVDAWLAGFSAEFSRELGSRGWLGMTWPRQYGGQPAAAAAMARPDRTGCLRGNYCTAQPTLGARCRYR